MEVATPPTHKVNVGKVISETFSVYGKNLGPLLGSAIAVFVVVGLAAGLLENSGGLVLALLAAVVRLAGHALYTGFVVRLVEDVRDGRRDQTVGDLSPRPRPRSCP